MIRMFYDLLYMLPVYLISVAAVCSYVEPMSEIAGLLLGGVALFITIVFMNLKTKLRFLIPAVLVSVFAAVVFLHKPEERLSFFLANLWVIALFAAAAVFFALGRVSEHYLWVKCLISVVLLTVAVGFVYHHIYPKKYLVVLAFFQGLVYLCDEIQKRWKKAGCDDNRKHLVCVAPVLLVLLAVVWLAPSRSTPYDWSFTKQAWAKASVMAQNFAQQFQREDDYASIGFSDGIEMNGLVSDDAEIVMSVTTGKGAGPRVYLYGRSFDCFDGRAWSSTEPGSANDRRMDSMVTLCAVNNYTDSAEDYLLISNIKIQYTNFRTRTVFVPEKGVITDSLEEEIDFTENLDGILARKKVRQGEFYWIHYYNINSGDDSFGDLVEHAPEITREQWEERLRMSGGFSDESLSYEAYLAYVDEIHEIYCDDVSISDELRAVLDEVYGDATTDWEKLNRLEAWLRSFEYTTEPGALPSSIETPEEFLDYLLLEKQEGYCVHFATAFVLIARAEGYPARLSEGFFIRCGECETIDVTTDMAHAWPEVYFDNVGWIVFEPTSANYMDASWTIGEENTVDATVDIGEDDSSNSEVSEVLEDTEMDDTQDMEEEEETQKNHSKSIGVIVAILFIFTIISLVIYQGMTRRNFASYSVKQKALIYCKSNLSILDSMGFHLKKGETIEEYSNRVIMEVGKEYGEDFLSFIPYYEVLLYAEREITQNDLATIMMARDSLHIWVKEKKGIWAIGAFIHASFVFALMVASARE